MADEFNDKLNDVSDSEQNKAGIDEEGVDPVSDFISVLDYLENELTNARAYMFNSKYKMIDEDKVRDILEDLHNVTPAALQYAVQMVAERDRINMESETRAQNKLAYANTRADAIIKDAEDRARSLEEEAERRYIEKLNEAEVQASAMTDQSAIKQQALAEASSIKAEAVTKVVELRDTAYDYCEHMLDETEKALRDAFDDVRRNRQQLQLERDNQRQKILGDR